MARTAHADIKDRILDAAEHRLWHYGFKKTTIDEIAADAGVGKGTVYLHFESKEDVAFEIIARYKVAHLEKLALIAKDDALSTQEKITQMLTWPILDALDRCNSSPVAQEFIVAIRPHLQSRIMPYAEREIELVAAVLLQGVSNGDFEWVDTDQTARTLKYMTTGFLPPFPRVSERDEVELEIGRMVSLVFRGLHCGNR